MMPGRERARLDALRAYAVLDSAPEDAFDDIARLAALICGTPMAAVSLVDADRQWFKARQGLALSETPRDVSFCDHALQEPDAVLEVFDATDDPRFATNPLVLDDPRIRFYAGAPLVTSDGHGLGALCVLDSSPRALSDAQRDALQALARQVVGLLEARRTAAALCNALAEAERAATAAHDAREQFRLAFDEVPVGMLVVGLDGLLRQCNTAFAQLVDRTPEELAGVPVAQVTADGERGADMAVVSRLLAGEARTVARQKQYRHRAGHPVDALTTTALLRAPDGSPRALLSWVEAAGDERTAERELLGARAALDAIISIDDAGIIVSWNAGAEAVFGWLRSEALGRTLEIIQPPSQQVALLAALRRLAEGSEPVLAGRTLRLRARRRDGRPLPVEVSLSRWSVGGRDYVTVVIRDVTASLVEERRVALAEAAAAAANTAATVEEAVGLLFDATRTAWGWSRASYAPVTEGEVAGTQVVRRDLAHEPARHHDAADADADADDADHDVELTVHVRVGARAVGTVTLIQQASTGADGLPTRVLLDDDGLLAVARVGDHLARVVEREQAARAALERARRDPLTGLGNHNHLAAVAAPLLVTAAGGGPGCALLLLDVDRFRGVNDALGHHAGDELIARIAAALMTGAPDGVIVTRRGGDEFTLLVTDTDALPGHGDRTERVLALGWRLLRRAAGPFRIDGLDVSVEASVGVALTPEHGTDLDGLLGQADTAMYVAKRSGSGVEPASPAARQVTAAQLSLLAQLPRAITKGQLRLHYQPQLDARGRLRGVEALLRWEHPEFGLLPPGAFLPLAEPTSLMVDLTRWVLDAAVHQAALWLGQGHRLVIGVNLSPRTLRHPGLEQLVVDVLDRHGLPPELLVLEVTETALMAQPEKAARALVALRELGPRLSLDDFGTGYTSLALLRDHSFDEIKLDQSFVARATTSPPDAAIAHSVVELAHRLGVVAVAEGIEDADTARLVRALGFDVLQGYHLGRPDTADALAGLLGLSARESPLATAGRGGGRG